MKEYTRALIAISALEGLGDGATITALYRKLRPIIGETDAMNTIDALIVDGTIKWGYTPYQVGLHVS